MKDTLKVLSIDFDYFQKVDVDTLAYYPDGNDLGTDISKFIWAGHYANPQESEKILSVEVDNDKLEHIKRILADTWNPGVQVMICNSHRHIYDLITTLYDEWKDEADYDGVDIYNIDMHHDMFNNNPNPDCGNWISHIVKEIPNSTVTWIANPASKEAYGLDEDRFDVVSEDLDDIAYMDYDIIFLCRSDMWTPPHLDSYFKDLAVYILEDVMGSYKGDAFVEDIVLEERDCTQEINQLKEAYSKFNIQVMH